MSVAVCFVLDAGASPGLLPRVLQPFAKRDLIPDRMRAVRSADGVRVEIEMDAMPEGEVHLVEGNLRQIVGVWKVDVRWPQRKLGTLKGQVWMAPDFDDTPTELIAAMEQRDYGVEVLRCREG